MNAGAADADFMLSTGRMPERTVEFNPNRRPPVYNPADIRAITSYVASFGSGPPIPQMDLATADLQQGASLYAINCEACHSAGGTGAALTNGFIAPPLRVATPTEIAEAIRVGPGRMPVFSPGTLSDQEVASIVRYVVDYVQRPVNHGGGGLGNLGPFSEGAVAWLLGTLVLVLVIRWIGSTG